jgi:hypothetical protein
VKSGPYRDGRIHVLADRCATCVFRPGNLMRLEPGRLADLVESNRAADSALTCNSTLYRDDVEPAVCRGYFDAYGDDSTPLRLAVALDVVEFDQSPPPHA